jgi:hypothetical protein
MTEIARRIKTAKRGAVRQRNYRRARDRAMTRLATAYPETYKELLEQEKIVDEQMGKKWLDLDGNTSQPVDFNSDTPPSSVIDGTQASTSANKSDNGGEA